MSNVAPSNGDVRETARSGRDQENLLDFIGEEESVAELSAQAAQRLSMLGEMTGGIVHDLRNILCVIESSIRLIERRIYEPKSLQIAIEGAQEGVARGLTLTSQLLRFAKQREFEVKPLNASELLRSLERFLKYAAGSRVRIACNLACDIPKCLVDPPQFNAAILNLVINARDAMPNGGEIRISTANCVIDGVGTDLGPGAYVRVRIEDNGQGMSTEVTRNVFESQFTTKGENGTGLGLPQVYRFMRQIGGCVNITSKLGLGTTVDLLFPVIVESRSVEATDTPEG